MGDADAQRSVDSLIPRTGSADISHVMAPFIWKHLIGAIPFIIDESRKAASLVLVPQVGSVGREGKDAPDGLPMQQVLTLCEPGLVATPVKAFLTVIAYVGHIPCVAFPEHRGAVYLVIVVSRGDDHAVFIWCAYLLVYALHLLLRDVLCRSGEHDKGQ